MAIEFKNDSSEEQERIVTSTLISEDEAEVSLRPRTLSEYIVQEKAKENLEVFISAARQRGPPPYCREATPCWNRRSRPGRSTPPQWNSPTKIPICRICRGRCAIK